MPLRRIALLTLLTFGCATVRVPVRVGSSEPADGAGVVAPPIVELWIESSEEVPQELAAKSDAQARAAIGEALAGREIRSDAAGATDAVLFVREKAVATTEARHSQQTWAKVGIVAGAVLIVAVIVAVVVSGKGSGGSGHSSAPSGGKGGSGGSAAKPSAASIPVKPRALPASPRPVAAVPRALPPRITPAPAPVPHFPAPAPAYVPVYGWRPSSPFSFGFYFDFWVPPRPMVLAPEEMPEDALYAEEPPVPLAPDAAPVRTGETAIALGPGTEPPPPAPDPDPEPAAAVALQLPPLSPAVTFDVTTRSFFAGPYTAIQLDLLDRASGQLVWTKTVTADADPLDAAAMAELLDKGFAGVTWAQRRR